MDGFQNRSSGNDHNDDFPTPKWATRAFIKHCMPEAHAAPHEDLVAWEPCANRGYMVSVLQEYFGTVIGTDIDDYGVGFPVADFLQLPDPATFEGAPDIDWIVTNPPFKLAEEFVLHWHKEMPSVRNLALLLRMNWMEGVKRYDTIFSKMHPKFVHPYAERVPIVMGRLDQKATTQMPYAWFVWDREQSNYSPTRVSWIPPSKKLLDRDEDWPQTEDTE